MITLLWPLTETSTLRDLTESASPRLGATSAEAAERVVVIVPLYLAEARNALSQIAKTCRESTSVRSLHILGLRSSLAPAISGREVPPHTEAEHKAIRLLPELTLSDLEVTFSLIENYNSQGECLNFSTESLAAFLALILESLDFACETIFSPAFVKKFYGQNFALGAAALRYDTRRSIQRCLNYLLCKEFEKFGYSPSRKPDVEAARSAATSCLEGLGSLYHATFQKEYLPKHRQGKAVWELEELINKEIPQLFTHISYRITKAIRPMDFRTREVALALILGTNADEPALDMLFKDAIYVYFNTETDYSYTNIDESQLVIQFYELQNQLKKLREHPLKNYKKIKATLKELKSVESRKNHLSRTTCDSRLMEEFSRVWVDEYRKLSNQLAELYQTLTAFNINMLNWYVEILRQKPDSAVELSTLNLRDDARLDNLLDTNRISAYFNFDKLFDSFAEGFDTFNELRDSMVNEITEQLEKHFSSFSLAEYLMGQEYPYLEPTDIGERLGQLSEAALPTCRNFAPELPAMELIEFAGVDPERLRAWKAATSQRNPQPSKSVATPDATTLKLLALQAIPLEYCR